MVTPPITPSQPAEWLPARVVLLCEPGLETLFSILQPAAANFLAPFSLAQAQAEHRAYRRALEAQGMRVIDIREALLAAGRASLQRWAGDAITLEADLDLTDDERIHAAQQLRDALGALDERSLLDLVLLRPVVRVSRNPDALDATTRFDARFILKPPSPYYTRDPLITTRRGVVITRLALAKRQPENDLAAHVLDALGIEPLYRVQPPGTLEGGDFIPCGDFVLQGQGLLTNEDGVQQCLAHRVYGKVEVAVVEDQRMHMDEMHLDTHFGLLDRDLAVCLADRLRGADEPTVQVHVPVDDRAAFRYVLKRRLRFSAYLQEKGIRVIPFSKDEQANFAANGLLTAPRRWIGVAQAGQSFAQRLQAVGVDATWLTFDALTGGYGGPHCSSQVLVRG